MSELCKWLHEQLEQLPMVRYPFRLELLPKNGIYFFYEEGEVWGHGGVKPRIVRIGAHSGKGNFRTRISEHFLLNESRMNFDEDGPKPSDRSIFRKNIGRAILNRNNDPYLRVWEIDFTSRENRERYKHLRDVDKERAIEATITKILRENFTFRFIALEDPVDVGRIKELEKALIGTVARCRLCRPSNDWLGRYSPKPKIRESGLWQEQHLEANPLSEKHKRIITDAVKTTIERYSHSKN